MSSVSVMEISLILPTYREPAHETLPMFAENRVHQRSSGNPYPNPVVLDVDRAHREDREYRCVRLENEYLRLEILPELGGRIYSAFDKTTGYDFFYKQHVVKPALIGLLGSWVSGGVEFNWPCHHRPSTFMPVDLAIEREADGAVTVWMSEHEPLDRMKGMVGVRLAPGAAVFETRMKVYNRTPTRRSFLWWENAAVPVNEDYQLFFPPDVRYVQFHYRKNVTSFPIAKGVYNGIRMGEGQDIRFHKNTRQPTSYFCAASNYDFFGGYDAGKGAGVVHVADRAVAVGKKMFTWAYNQLSRSWERALTDTDGMYAELMAGSYSSNQPDFAWLEPYEEKTFTQSWYPIGALGPPVCATYDAALSVGEGRLLVQATRALRGARLLVNGKATRLDLTPGRVAEIPFQEEVRSVRLLDAQGLERLAYQPACDRPDPRPEPIADNPTLEALEDAQACYLAGVHVAQYRDPAILPDAYWREALRRDPNHAPSLHAMARFLYDRAFYEEALSYGLRAWKAVTRFNFHPESGDFAYTLGLICEALRRDGEAWDWHQKAAWAQDARSRAMTRIAMIDGRRGDAEAMERHAREALRAHGGNGTARACLASALRRQGRGQEASDALRARLAEDPLDLLCGALLEDMGEPVQMTRLTDAYQNALDLEEDLRAMGEDELADSLSSKAQKPQVTAFPFRHGEIAALRASRADDYGLACALYGRGHYAEAAELWRGQPEDFRALRNLAVACYSHLNRREEALALLQRAQRMAPENRQLVWETAYLMGRMQVDARERIDFLRPYCHAETRGDILIEYARALNCARRHEQALEALLCRQFTPCEGGEHAVAEQYMYAHHAMGRDLYAKGSPEAALEHFRAAQALPDSLGAGLWNEVWLVPHRFYEAECLQSLGQAKEARRIYVDIAALLIDYFSSQHLPELRCWQALCWARLGQAGRAEMMLREHIRLFEAARGCRDAGYFRTTPFFICYMEPAEALRKAACDGQQAVAYWAMGEAERTRALAAESLRNEPFALYQRLLVSQP